MFDHVTIRARDRDATERLYRAVLGAVGREPTYVGPDLVEWDDLSIAQATPARPATTGAHLGLGVGSRHLVDAFWRAGRAAGGPDDGAPGPRPAYTPDYYGGFLLDPDGNSIEAVHHAGVRAGVDHVWIRVADLARSRRLWAELAPAAGLRVVHDGAARLGLRHADGAALSLVEGPPTANLHLAFPAADRAAVERFHAAALAAGFADDGPPGERPAYHPGYYAAFVRDPDGTSLELVLHDRP